MHTQSRGLMIRESTDTPYVHSAAAQADANGMFMPA